MKTILLLLACLGAAGCLNSPTAPTETPLMILNPNLQGIASTTGGRP